MRKFWLYLVLLAALVITACVPQQPAAVTPVVPTDNPASVKMECQVVGALVTTPDATLTAKFPPNREGEWAKGSPTATLRVIEYSDYQCPYCALLSQTLDELYEKHPDDVQIIFRNFPLPNHQLGLEAAYAAEAAGKQGKFWEFHREIFAKQAEWARLTSDQFTGYLVDMAESLDLDRSQFEADMTSQEVIQKVQAEQKHALDEGIEGTPFMLLNGLPYNGPRDLASLESILGLFQLEKRQFTYCPPMVIDTNKQYTATISTDKGDIVLELFADKAPLTVNSFVFLAQNNWFDNTHFHRVIPGFVAQGGDPSNSGYGGPGYTFKDEITELKFDSEGMVGMANAGPGSNGSQFFITLGPANNLNDKFTIFGRVIEGIEIAKKFDHRDPSNPGTDLSNPGVKINSVTITEQ
jgi:cyclophilin family peptidyl-prolyl cis-trans isomerase/protein-disulfide isomerase